MSRRPSTERTRRPALAAALAVALAASGCSQFGTDGLQLQADDSIEIVTPDDRATVDVPLEVRWTDSDPRPGGTYAVIIDRAPMPPGETVDWFARDDADCAATAGCPDEVWLARRGITVTDGTELSIAIVPPLDDDERFHELTVVRLDGEGRRDGEGAFRAQFEVAEP